MATQRIKATVVATWREVQAQTFTDTFLVMILPLVHKWCRQRRHIDAPTASPERSPRHRHSFIERQHIGACRAVSDNSSITRQKAETLGTRLGNQHPVKRIAMPLRQCDQ
jgi:hypothetical protein